MQAPKAGRSYGRGALAGFGIAGGVVGFAGSALLWATLQAAKAARVSVGNAAGAGAGFDLPAAIGRLLRPESGGDWLQLVALVSVGGILGLFTAAIFAARSAGSRLDDTPVGDADSTR